MSLQNLYLSWGEILSPNCEASWPSAGTPRVSAWACIRQHLSVEAENMASKSSPSMVGRVTPAANLVCLQAVKPAFFFHYSLQAFPLESAFPTLASFFSLHMFFKKELHLKLLFLLLPVSLSLASTSSLGLKQQSHSANTPAA